MLKKRVITAAILVPLLLFAILFAHPLVLLGLLAFILALSIYEWQALIPVITKRDMLAFWFIMAVSVGICFEYFNQWLLTVLSVWMMVIVAIVTYPHSQGIWGRRWVVTAVGCLFLPLMTITAMKLYQAPHGPGLIIYVCALVSVSDSGAYFVGRAYGQHKLIPKVSAGKTLEGALGGLLLPMLVAWAGASMGLSELSFAWFGLAFLTVLIAMFGDLSISMLKRRQHLKDTGALLPGHGGVLDRIDSIIAALPWFYFGYNTLLIGK